LSAAHAQLVFEKRFRNMEDRRRIVIPIGEKPETPHFDAEETLLSARPVVPLAASSQSRVESAGEITHPPFRRRYSFLALIVLAAVGLGIAAGLSIARYRYRQRTTTAPVAAQAPQTPAATDTRTATVQTPVDNPQAQAPQIPEVNTVTTAETAATGDQSKTSENEKAVETEKTGEAERAAPPQTKASDAARNKTAGDRQDEDNGKTAPRVRDNNRAGDDTEENADDVREQRRARRVRRRDDDDTITLPRTVERTSEQINRIREIFEGRRQRP
jgi:cytoskeletal protein RodZ